MKTPILYLAVILLTATLPLSNCFAQAPAGYANALTGCLTDVDIELLNQACQAFEKQLADRYSGQETGQAYRAFLLDIRAIEVPAAFFMAPEARQALQQLKRADTFDKIWANLSAIESQDDFELIIEGEPVAEPKQEKELYCANPDGAYLDCLIRNNENEVLASYLKSIKAVSGISPGFTAGMLYDELATEDYDDGLIRLAIAIGFFYEVTLFFEGLNKE